MQRRHRSGRLNFPQLFPCHTWVSNIFTSHLPPLPESTLTFQPLFSSFLPFLPHLTLTPPPAGGPGQRAEGVAGEGSPADDSQPEPVLAGARRVRAGGAAQRRAAEDAQRWGDAHTNARTLGMAPKARGGNIKAAFNVETGARHTCKNTRFFCCVCVFFFFREWTTVS